MSDNILVAIKTRPLISREISETLRRQWAVEEKTIYQIDENGHRLSEPYSFDHIFTEFVSNANVYDQVVKSLVQSFQNGFNSTIFAYGQTSSGKTHTMMGTDAMPGIIQMAINDVFEHVSCDAQRRYLISCSYFEIYNEKINDLLDRSGRDLKIREDFCGGTFVNAKEEVVTKANQVYELMKIGGKIRKIGCTNMNERSSRSHTIFRLTLKSTENNLENASMQISHLYLVDLAGSERIAHTNAQGVRLKEGVNINKSLLALGNVIRQLSEGEGYINYRDSNLTRLLQQALGGNAKSLIIATITIAAGEETRSTLEFAQRAKVVKNKPIINKLLSEQDKLKQYELATEAYKVRLKKEAQRIREMEKEKEEREQEMLKLKQQVKLIDLFTNGPDQKNIESRIPRRHTMGHYASRIPLQTIPESRMLPSNIMPEKSFGNGTKSDLDDEQLFLKRASQVSDYECMKMSIEETLDDVMLPVTPEPSEELTVQEPTTPASHLRERLRYLEESYTSLKEFTKLEAQCREDKDVLQDLVKEKENLLKDLIDMNVIIRDTRQEKEQIKMKFEDEIATLKKDLQCVTQKCDRFSFALEQAEAEKDALRLAKEQLLNDNEVILDQQKLKYENKLEYFMKEIEKLKEHGTENHKEEIQRLRKENEDFKSNIVKITIYEEKIEELEEKLQKFERKEEEDIDILSKLYFLQDILLDDNVDIQGVSTQTEELTLEVNEAEKTVIKDVTNETITQKVYEELKEKIEILNGKLKDMQTLNLALGNEIDAQKEQIHSKDVKIEELTNNLKKINFGNKEEIQYREQNILKLNEKVKNLEEIQEKDNEILQLRNQLKFFETSNCDNKKYIQARDDKILELTDKINDLEKCNNDNNEEIHLRDNHILELKNKITDLEKCSQVNKDLIQIRDNKILELTNRINDLEKCNDDNNEVKDNHILELKNKITDLEKCSQVNKDLIQIRDNKILELTNRIVDLEKCNDDNNEIKDNHILELKNKITDLEKCSQVNKDLIQIRDNKILELTNRINDLEKCNDDNEVKDNHILELKNKITDLEKCSQVNKDLIQIRDNKILELTNRINDLEKCNDDNEVKDNHILELKNKITDLEKCSQVNKDLIQIRDNKILELTNRINDLEKCNNDNNEVKDNHILELKNKITDLEKCSQVNKDLIQIRDNKILELTNRINDLEKCNDDNKEKIHVRDNHILELRNKLTDLEKCNQVNKDLIRIRDNKILELNNRINDLEKCNDDNKEKIQVKDNRMLELRNKLTDLEKCNQDNKDLIQIRDNKILELTNRINGLEKCNDGNKEKILVRDNHILELRNKLTDLEKCNPVNKNLIQIRDNKILELTNRIDDLEKCNDDNKEKIQVRDNRILELRNKLTDLEKCNRDNKDLIQIRDNKILELINRINDLEKCNDDNKEKIQVRDNRILELRNKIICLEKCNKEDISRYKDHIKSRDDTIMELNNKITKLNEACRNYEDDVSQCKKGIFHQERRIKELTTGKIDSNTCRSSVSPSSHDPSPKELRKMKRQSIHDQRRGIDLAVAAAAIVSDEEPTIKTLKEKIEYLTNENKFLEFEVQGFIRELDDCKLYNRERDKEIDVLQEQIKKMKNVKVQEKCTECQQKRHYIKQLEDLQKINKFKIVDLQTKIYDLENVLKTEKANMEEKERCMRYDITELERRLSDGPPPKLEDAEIQCELVNIEQLLEKYSVVKKLARMRRNEANILRARLGIDPDEPVT